MRQITMPMIPITRAPPTPTTTPMTTFLFDSDKPESLESFSEPLRLGELVAAVSLAVVDMVVGTGVPLTV